MKRDTVVLARQLGVKASFFSAISPFMVTLEQHEFSISMLFQQSVFNLSHGGNSMDFIFAASEVQLTQQTAARKFFKSHMLSKRMQNTFFYKHCQRMLERTVSVLCKLSAGMNACLTV